MPTGYTAGVVDGSITTLEQYALQCARGMGALVMMRDEPWDAPIPEKFEPSPWNKNKLDKALEELDQLRLKSQADLTREAQASFDEKVEQRKERMAKNAEAGRRYEAMMKLVQDYRGAPEGLKKFMQDQLNSGYEYDYDAYMEQNGGWYSFEKRQEYQLTADEFFAAEEARLMKDVAYHSEEYAKELERTEARNKWLQQLRVSLSNA